MTLQSLGAAEEDSQIARLGPRLHNLHLPDGSQTAMAFIEHHMAGDHTNW